MRCRDIINYVKQAEQLYNGTKQLSFERIKFFQKTNKYDRKTYEIVYDNSFEQLVIEFENQISGRIYRPTSKKILNNWYAWAREKYGDTIKVNTRNLYKYI